MRAIILFEWPRASAFRIWSSRSVRPCTPQPRAAPSRGFLAKTLRAPAIAESDRGDVKLAIRGRPSRFEPSSSFVCRSIDRSGIAESLTIKTRSCSQTISCRALIRVRGDATIGMHASSPEANRFCKSFGEAFSKSMMIFAPCQHLRILLVASATRSAGSGPRMTSSGSIYLKALRYLLEGTTLNVSRRGDAAHDMLRMAFHQRYQRLTHERARFNNNCRSTIPIAPPPSNDNPLSCWHGTNIGTPPN